MATVLDRILEAHRATAAADDRPLDALVEEAKAVATPTRAFRAALALSGSISVIAEIKRRSPSKGDLATDLVPSTVAKSYEAGGASCLSVLTDREFFGGSREDLAEARDACALPVLRKDFTVEERDVCDARLMGADAVLLIAAALTTSELARCRELAAELGLAALVEVHDSDELTRALAAGADIVGVNQRDLRTFTVNRSLATDLASLIPDGVVKVAESGVRDHGDVAVLVDAGYDAVLVGESLITAADPGAAVRTLKGV